MTALKESKKHFIKEKKKRLLTRSYNNDCFT